MFVHNEDRGKLDPPAHKGVYMGDCAHTDGIYIWDQDHPEQPVRISRNFLGRSFHEQCAVTFEPIGVSDEQYEMLQDEVNQLKNNSFENDCEDHPAFDLANVPKERLEHWKNVQQFVKSRREWYAQHSSLSLRRRLNRKFEKNENFEKSNVWKQQSTLVQLSNEWRKHVKQHRQL